MTMGIEHFRAIVEDKDNLANRRITVEQENGRELVRAPHSRGGRFIDWIKGGYTRGNEGAKNLERLRENPYGDRSDDEINAPRTENEPVPIGTFYAREQFKKNRDEQLQPVGEIRERFLNGNRAEKQPPY